MNRKDIIKKMANAVRCVNLYGKEDGHEYIEGSQKIAEAALDASLNELKEPEAPTGVNDVIDIGDLYYELLEMRKK